MTTLNEFWSNIENVRNASPEDIQSDVLAYLNLLTEKDATIDEQQTEMDRINNHLYKACMDVEALRKALEEAKSIFGLIATHSTDEKAVKVATNGFNLMDSALGEGDKE